MCLLLRTPDTPEGALTPSRKGRFVNDEFFDDVMDAVSPRPAVFKFRKPLFVGKTVRTLETYARLCQTGPHCGHMALRQL